MSAEQPVTTYPELTPRHAKAYDAVLKHVQQCRTCAAMKRCERGAALRKAVREARR